MSKKLDVTTGKAVIYEYDSLGRLIHSYQTDNGTIQQHTEHLYDTENRLVSQTWTSGSTSHVMDFVYDNAGKPYALKYDGSTYYYVLNLQGDVISIITHWGAAYGTYTYDAWGNVISQSGSIASINPIRYRGYYYDSETGLYYLGSRYYDPAVKRFINADDAALAAIGSYNNGLIDKNYFAYCNNAPVNSSDDGGDLPTVIVGAIVGGVLGAIDSIASGDSFGEVAFNATKGALEGALSSTLKGPASIVCGAVSGAVDAALEVKSDIKEKRISAAGAVVKIATGTAVGALFSAIGEGGKIEKLSSLKTFGGDVKTMFKNRLKKGRLYKVAKNSAKQYIRNSGKQLKKEFISSFISSHASSFSNWLLNSSFAWATR